MATLAPVLGGNAASFERPTEQGVSGLQGLASVLGTVGNAISTAITQNQPAAPREPTQDERFGQAWTQFVDSVGTALDPSNPNYIQNLRTYTPQFLRAFPEFASQTGQLLRTQGVENTLTPQQRLEQTEETQMVEFFGSSEGRVEEALARQAATSADGVFNEQAYNNELDQRYGSYIIRQADYSRLSEEAQAGADIKVISERFWDVAAQEADSFVQGGMSDLFNIIEQMRLNPGGRVELDPATAASMGLPTSTITAENLPLVLQTFRNTLRMELRDTLQGQASFDVNPPSEEWYDQALAPFDALTQAAGDFDSLPSISSAIQSAGTINAYRDLRATNPTLAAKIDFFNVVSPSLMTNLQQYTSGIGQEIQDYTATLMGINMTQEEAAAVINDLPINEAEGVLETTAALLANGDQLNPDQIRNAYTTMVEADRRVNGTDSYFSADAWQTIVGANTQHYLQAAQMDPSFATTLERGLLSDINKTLTQVINLNTGSVLLPSMNPDGTIGMSVNEELINRQISAMGYPIDPTNANYVQERENIIAIAEAQLNNATLDLYNMKVQTLNGLGQVGSQILDAIVMQNNSMIPEEAPEGGMSQGGSRPTQENASDSFTPQMVQLPEEVMRDQEFIDQVQIVSERLGMNPNDLLGIMAFETGGSFSPSIPNAAGSGATGLIQFMPSTARGLGTTTEALAGMTRAEQMRYVEAYFRPFAGRLNNFGDAYMAVLWPAAVGKSDDYVLFSGGKAYEQNAGLDLNGDGVITRGEAVAKAAQRAGVTNFQSPTGPVGGRPSEVFGDQPDVQPYRRPAQTTQDTGVLRPRGRPSEPASGAPMRPQARPNASSQSEATNRTSASQQATRTSRAQAIEVLLRNGFSRSELDVMGIN